MLREAATVAAGTAVATLAIRHVDLLKALLSPATAWVEERAPSLVLLLVLAIIGFYQITTHVFHPPIIAVFGGKRRNGSQREEHGKPPDDRAGGSGPNRHGDLLFDHGSVTLR